MRRADRLFHIVQLIRGRRMTTAAYLAQRLEVSERTIYRDVADLQVQGVPLQGEAGVGYRLGAGFDLPPMMFTQDEAEALVVYAPSGGLSEPAQRTLQTLREAVQERRKIFINYLDLSEKASERTLRPLGCFYWGKVWTLAAWCEQRNDFRSFRVDRVTYVRRLDEQFRDEPGRTLADLERRNEANAREQGWAS